MTANSTAQFESLPLSEQLKSLEQKLAGSDPRELLSLCAQLRDAAPLSWLATRLLSDGWFDEPDSRTWFASFLGTLPDTAVHKILRDALASGTGRDRLRDTLLLALESVALERLSTLCLLDRALKHNFQDARDAHVADVVARCKASLASGDAAFPLHLLAQVPARTLPDLLAAAPDQEVRDAFDARRAELARRAIEVLGDAPKAVSQANAEELLARRVYTDPGHFLIELLQNAEDAGASVWRVDFGDRAITVWHNGTPFDAKDLVGVTSIGQTTKRKQQIGFFGVGFKSVYEVTDRPRIYSDVYQFEIADVSIPKYLGARRPDGVRPDGTVLVLPLRDPSDPVRSPRALYEKARALDPCVLITLAGIDEIHLTLSEGGGGPDEHRLIEVVEQGRASSIRQEPLGWDRHYVLRQATPRFVGGAREAGRADTTTIMVGVQVEGGTPVPCDEATSTIYSYLPTAESSGLRFFVQAHFDVPVDRERVTQDSDWNRWILSHVPALLAEVAEETTTASSAAGLLDVLPLPGEMSNSLFKSVANGLRRAFRDAAILPDASGTLRTPRQVVLAQTAVAALLGDRTLPDGRSVVALPEVEPERAARRLEVAQRLGVGRLGVERLLESLEAIAQGREPSWYLRLHDVVLGHVESLERDGHRLKARGLLVRLAKLPVIPDEDGAPRCPGSGGPGLPEPGLRPLFQGLRSIAHPVFDAQTPLAERARSLMDRLGTPGLGLEAVVDALASADDLGPWLPRMEAVMDALADAPSAVRERAASLPVFPTQNGARSALAGKGRAGAYVLRDARFGSIYTGRRALLADELAAGMTRFVSSVDVPGVDLSLWIADLSEGSLFPTDPAALRELHVVMEEVRDDVNARDWKRLADLSIWPDRAGLARPLRGKSGAAVPVQPEIVDLFPTVSFLDEEVAARAHVADAGARTMGADAVVQALESGRDTVFIERASAYLVAHGSRLGSGARRKLADACAWIDDRGQPRVLSDLFAADGGGRALYEAAGGEGGFMPASGPSSALLQAMGLAGELRQLDAATVLGRVLESGRAAGVEERSPVGVHPVLAEPSARNWMYSLFRSDASSIFADGPLCARLREGVLFPTTEGSLLAPASLVLDDRLPDLGVDWLPHPEIPRDVLDLLQRHLDVGRPPLTEIVETHLRPALDAAAAARDGDRSARLLAWLAQELEDPATVRGWLESVQVEASDGSFQPLTNLLLPNAAVEPWMAEAFGDKQQTPSTRLGAGALGLLQAMGLPVRPSRTALSAALQAGGTCDRGIALAALVSERTRALGVEDGLDGLPISTANWLPDGEGIPRQPGRLFHASPEVEALIGHEPGSYAHPDAWRHLDDVVRARMGLRAAADVGLDDVLAHIARSRDRRVPVLLRVYEWMERGLDEGWISAGDLKHKAQATALICADDGEYYAADQVVGELTFRLFGAWRGYWERGAERCPKLCRALGVVREVKPRDIVTFLREVGDVAAAKGADTLLESDPALPRMLLACYARLGGDDAVRLVPRTKPMILAHCDGVATLVRPSLTGLYRSDTPTLESLFEGTGKLHLAAQGPVDDRASVDAFLERVGVGLLRDKYRVSVVTASGREVTEHRGQEIAGLRGVLRALCDVLPRVELHRRGLRESGWNYRSRLRALANSGTIRVIENLAVRYVLPGVGSSNTDAASAFDPVAQALFVESQVVADVPTHATGLALGLLGCIYDGPGESQLLDIVELLIARGSRAAMDANLDQKHYPRSAVRHTVADALSERLGEILDYGLDRRLARRFPALEGCDFRAWRSQEVLARAVGDAVDEDRAAMARRVAPHLLEALGATAPEDALVAILTEMLAAPSLSELPGELTVTSEPDLAPIATPGRVVRPNLRGPRRLEELSRLLAEYSPERSGARPQPTAPVAPVAPLPRAPAPARPDRSPGPEGAEAARGPDWDAVIDSSGGSHVGVTDHQFDLGRDTRPRRPGPREEPGLFDRVASFFGFGDESEPVVQHSAPEWATMANPLRAVDHIGPQLWATPSARKEVANRSTTAALIFEPKRLALPYLYAVQVVGTEFDESAQTWMPGPALDDSLFAGLRPRGQRVLFEGRVEPGRSQIPLPLHSRLDGPPVLVGGTELEWVAHQNPPRLEVTVSGDTTAMLRYHVELSALPRLARATGDSKVPERLTQPTMDRHDFPIEVWRFLEEQGRRGSLWERAVAVQAFVQSRYLYDDAFLERPDVMAAMRKLGRGNHHLQLLHASAGDDFLGRGICYELNTMVVELCRHLGVPAMVATGWVLDTGRVDRPDHLFALTVLPSPQGACLYPLDAAVGDGGPRRPLNLVSTGPQVPRADPPPADPGWAAPSWPQGADPGDVDDLIDGLVADEEGAVMHELEVLTAALERLGVTVPETPEGPSAWARRLRVVLGRALGDPATVEVLLSVARQPRRFQQMTPELEILAGRGLVEVEVDEVYEVTTCLS
jgi:hypothetical protein